MRCYIGRHRCCQRTSCWRRSSQSTATAACCMQRTDDEESEYYCHIIVNTGMAILQYRYCHIAIWQTCARPLIWTTYRLTCRSPRFPHPHSQSCTTPLHSVPGRNVFCSKIKVGVQFPFQIVLIRRSKIVAEQVSH
jgi:hypothetical protein